MKKQFIKQFYRMSLVFREKAKQKPIKIIIFYLTWQQVFGG
jgi:hypothetical protein